MDAAASVAVDQLQRTAGAHDGGGVGVRGAGTAFDGLHYVSSVTHTIKRGEYKQSFELVRNGLISTLRRVPA